MPSGDSTDLAAGGVFVAVVEAGSLSEAAKRLGVTKSAVSKRLAQLEARLGVRLLHRTTRSLALTEAGERFHAHASTAVEAMLLAEHAATELQREPRGRLRVTALMAFGKLHVTPLIGAFMAEHPNLAVSLNLDDRTHRIHEGEFDVALWAGPIADSSMVARTIAPLHSVVCASPGYLSSREPPQHPRDLLDHDCVSYSYSDQATHWTFVRDGTSESVTVTSKFEVNNGEALCEVMMRGLGVSRLPTFIAGPHIASGALVPLLGEYTMPSKDLCAVYPDRAYLPRKVRVFIDHAVEAFGGPTPPWDAGWSRA